MITTKQRAYLRALANAIQPSAMIGKEGLTDNILVAIDGLLEARELVKIKVLKTSPKKPRELTAQVMEALSCQPVQVIGLTIVIYRQSTKKDFKHIELPR